MRRLVRLQIYLALIFILDACNSSSDKVSIFYLDEYEAKDIGFNYGSMVYKSNVKNKFEEILIFSEIIEFKKIPNCILVKQRFNERNFINFIVDNLDYKLKFDTNSRNINLIEVYNINFIKDSINNISDSYFRTNYIESVIKKSNYFKDLIINKENYYLIDSSSHSVTGPLRREEVLKKISNV